MDTARRSNKSNQSLGVKMQSSRSLRSRRTVKRGGTGKPGNEETEIEHFQTTNLEP